MAYNQILDSVVLRTMYFTTSANVPISSQYTLYANGTNPAYFSNAVLPEDLSTISTSLGQTNSNVVNLSSQVSTLTYNVNSSISSLYTVSYSTQQYAQDTSNALAAQVNAFYASTIDFVESTLLGFSTYSSFIYQYNELSTTANNNFSTLSSYITSQAATTYLTTYTDVLASTNTYIESTINYVDRSISTISTLYVPYTTLAAFSTAITTQLISSSAGLATNTTRLSTNTFNAINALSTSTGNSLSTLFSTTAGHGTELAMLEDLSTNISSVTASFYAPALSTSQALQDIATASTFAAYSSLIAGNTDEIELISTFLFPYAAGNSVTVSSLNGNLSSVSSSLSTLLWEFNLLTTSSILSSIYFSFYNLEIYASSIVSTTQGGYAETLSSIAYSSYTQNVSVANSYFNYYVSTMYASTLSTLVPSTIAFTSSLMSTLYSTGYYLFESTIASTILSTLFSTNQAYLNQIEPGILTHLASTLATRQFFSLSTTNTTAMMDLSTFQNFNISLRVPTDPNIYRITYDANSLSNRDYQTGIIAIDVSTIGVNYSTNSGALSLQTYHWGYPTYVDESFIPYISNADYTLHYEYTILNQTLYTNLLNVYPRTGVSNLILSTFGTNAVYRNGTQQSGAAWRGGTVTARWSPYAWFPPYGIKGPTYRPQILIDVIANGVAFTSGPFPLQQSTATFQMPRLPYTGTPVLSTTITAYVAGRVGSAATASVGLVFPVFGAILLSNTATGTFIGGNGIQAYSDAGAALLNVTMPIKVSSSSGNSNYNAIYAASNLLTNNANTNFIGPSPTGPDVAAGATVSTLLAVAVSSLIYSTFTSAVSGIATSAMSARQQLVCTTFSGGAAYSRILPLTASTQTVFAM